MYICILESFIKYRYVTNTVQENLFYMYFMYYMYFKVDTRNMNLLLNIVRNTTK